MSQDQREGDGYDLFAVYILLVLFNLFFDHEDGGNIFLRNVGERLPSYTPLHSRRQHSL
jgi:hypothetical protein